MIIKSMSRSTGSFAQLVEYCENGRAENDQEFNFYHNLHPGDKEQIIRDFQNNSENLSDRKNGVKLYHEILSFTRAKGISTERQKEILRDTVAEYLSRRAPECMAYSVIHDEKEDHLHAHIIISSNLLDNSKRHRLSKYDFEKIKRATEKLVLENHPDMEQGLTIDKVSRKRKSAGEAELKRRGGRTTQKDNIHNDLKEIFNTAKTRQALEAALRVRGLGMSFRKGNPEPRFGKAESKKHFRLKTLGLETEYSQLIRNIEIPEDPTVASKADTAAESNKESNDNVRNTARKPQKPAEQYPWQADTEKREKQAREPSAGESLKKTSKEWIQGDFSERDKDIQRAKYKKQNNADEKVKSHKEQTFFENRFEEAKEWFAGDFSARESRQRKQKYEKLKKDSSSIKEKGEQSTKERVSEKYDEYVKGDFSARDARAFKRKREKNLDDYKERLNQADKEARDAWMKGDETREFIEEKVRAEEAEKQAQLLRAQNRESAIQKTRSELKSTHNNGKQAGDEGKGEHDK